MMYVYDVQYFIYTVCWSDIFHRKLGITFTVYSKCPKILYTSVSDKIAYAIAYAIRSSLVRVYTVCHSTKNF